MAILGFVVLVLLATYLLVGAYATAMMEVFMGGEFPKIGALLASASLGLYYWAYVNAPFTIALTGK